MNKDKDSIDIGKNIQNLRKYSNMTQQDLADSLGISRSAISRIESKSSLDTDLLFKISKTLNVPLITLLSFQEGEAYENIAATVLEAPKSIRDLHKNNIELYKKLPDKTRNFVRALGLEIHNEIINSEINCIEKFSRSLQISIGTIFDDLNESLKSSCIQFIDNYTDAWIDKILEERRY